MRRMLGTIVGGAIVVFVIANVQFGAVAPLAIDGVEDAKLDVFMLSDPSCGFEAIEAEIEAMGTYKADVWNSVGFDLGTSINELARIKSKSLATESINLVLRPVSLSDRQPDCSPALAETKSDSLQLLKARRLLGRLHPFQLSGVPLDKVDLQQW